MSARAIIVCIDGFDPEYLEACDMPVFTQLAAVGQLTVGRSMMPSVTNVNNVSLVTASYPEVHGICSNYWLIRDSGEEVYTESAEYILAETMFQRARSLGKRSVLITSKDKLRTLLSDGATVSVSSERPPDWLVKELGPPPEIYSVEVNGWTIRAAGLVLQRHPAEVVYVTTTDYAMHTYAPDEPESARHMALLDEAIGGLVDANPDATLLVTADHGMSPKTRMVDVSGVLAARGIRARAVPIIKDRYVVHHANLGGCAYVYLDEADVPAALDVLGDTPGVEDALRREEAASELRLLADRIGDIVVTGDRVTVFGDPSEVELLPRLRSHGSHHERDVPILAYNGDFRDFSFAENRDLGRYVFDHVLA
jgi:phosphonoacetate hydrolase